jgi:hypothetical protein
MPTFSKILRTCADLSRELPDAVWIGGVAVYLHAASRPRAGVEPEGSHDADFMISFEEYGVLKDVEEVSETRRLGKHQMLYMGVEFDIYVERMSRLIVPYDDAYAHSDVVLDTRVACLEHLLALKLEALASRGHSSKGEKDRRDVVKIGILLGRRPRRRLLEPYMRPELESLLTQVGRSAIFYDMSGKNAHAARKMRAAFGSFVASVT